MVRFAGLEKGGKSRKIDDLKNTVFLRLSVVESQDFKGRFPGVRRRCKTTKIAISCGRGHIFHENRSKSSQKVRKSEGKCGKNETKLRMRFSLIFIDFCCILGAVLGAKMLQKWSKKVIENRPSFRYAFSLIFMRFGSQNGRKWEPKRGKLGKNTRGEQNGNFSEKVVFYWPC